MESYPEIRKALGGFLGNMIHNLAVAQTYTKDAQTVQVDGTSYEEFRADESYRFDLKEYQTKIELHNEEVKRLDFSALRGKIFQAAKGQAKEMNKDFLENLESEGLMYDGKGKSAIDTLLGLMRIYKKKGFNLDSMRIISSYELHRRFQKEMENPLNQERFYREWNRIRNESN